VEISHLYSFNTLKQTFDIKTLNDIIPVTVSFDPNRHVPSGSPGVVNKNTLFNTERFESRSVPVLFPFSPRTGVTPGTCIKINSKNIYELPQKNLIVGHKVKTIDKFNVKNLKKIRDFVKDNAAITFALFDASNAIDFFASIPDLCSRYNHSTFFYHYGNGLSGHIRDADDVFVSFVSFIDINYCIPIFDHRKVDGMGVYCGLMYNNKKNKGSILIDVLCSVLSNHKENLLYTDGTNIATESRVSNDVLKYMIQRIKLKSKCKMEKAVTDKVKKVKNDENTHVEEDLCVYADEKVVRYSMSTSGNSSSTYTISGSWA